MRYLQDQGIVFQHLVNFPRIDCVFCSVTFKSTGRVCLILVFRDREHVYMRNSCMKRWEKIEDRKMVNMIRSAFKKVIRERRVPCYSLDDFDDVVDLKEPHFVN